MGVYELSGAGSLKTGRTLYTSMNAGNQYGAMVPIASLVLASNTAAPQFSNIPQTYRDLLVVIAARSTNTVATEGIACFLNSDSNPSNNSSTYLVGDGSSASSSRTTSQYGFFGGSTPGANATSGIFGASEIHILNYANTSTFKTGITRSGADLNGSGNTYLVSSLWKSTAAINNLIFQNGAQYATGSTFTLYGIRAVSS